MVLTILLPAGEAFTLILLPYRCIAAHQILQRWQMEIQTKSFRASARFFGVPCGPGYPFIRLQALGAWPVSTAIPYAGKYALNLVRVALEWLQAGRLR